MMPKPEILQGNVIEFTKLDLWIDDNQMEVHSITHQWQNRINKYENLNKLRKFVNQPFDTKMITEYFEGWIQATNIEGTPIEWWHSTEIENAPFVFEFEIMRNYKNELSKYCEYNDGKIKCPTPKILLHFINDCIRAGIILIWKNK